MKTRRILVVEDEYFIADDCAKYLREEGFEVVGPFCSLKDAIEGLPPDIGGALLDIDLQGTAVYPLLDRLLSRNIPVTIYTGFESQHMPERYAKLRVITKPATCREVVRTFCT